MEVLILSKTEYGSTQYCIGGITVDNHQFIRLLRPDGSYQPRNTELEIGDIWDINFRRAATTREPHNEDVIVIDKTFIKKVYKLKTYISDLGVRIWRGSIVNAFDGNLRWTGSGSGFLSESQRNLPEHSVGFWIPNEDLEYRNGYYYTNGKKINYKGAERAKANIPAGSLIRLSLAKWWCPEDFYESRCYLQLSGWYEDKPEPKPKPKPEPVLTSASTAATSYSSKPAASRTSNSSTSSSSYKTPATSTCRSSSSANKNTSGGCYIATVCYNDYYADEVCTFRDFRDHTLRKSALGRKFISYYYRNAPEISEKLRKKPLANAIIKRVILNNLLSIIRLFCLNQP